MNRFRIASSTGASSDLPSRTIMIALRSSGVKTSISGKAGKSSRVMGCPSSVVVEEAGEECEGEQRQGDAVHGVESLAHPAAREALPHRRLRHTGIGATLLLVRLHCTAFADSVTSVFLSEVGPHLPEATHSFQTDCR